MKLNDFNIGPRLAIAFGLVLLVVAALAAAGVWRLEALKRDSHQVATIDMERSVMAHRWSALIELNWVRTLAALRSTDTAQFEGWVQDMDKTSKQISEVQKQLEQSLGDDVAGKALMAEVATAREAYRGPRAALMKARRAGDDVSAAVEAQLRPLANNYLAALARVRNHMSEQLASEQQASLEGATASQWLLAGGAGLATALALWLSVATAKSITQPLRLATGVASAIAAGDLTVYVQALHRDETGRLLQTLADMRDSLARIVDGVRHGADGVATASAQIASGNQDLSARTESQASALQQTAASTEQLDSTVRQNAEHAQRASQLAEHAAAIANQGGEAVGRVVSTMHGINDASLKIAEIVGVIDGLAFQTNILALNAAVEAARAGEQGRGFAVVASEVRSLAGRSAEAAKQIRGLIDTSVERVTAGSRLVDDAGLTMEKVVEAIASVTQAVGEISRASAEQASGVGQVGQVVQQMDRTTQQNAALVEEMAAAANSLSQQARALVGAVAVFRLAPSLRGAVGG
jgi:methyl-accepting chemotaxis protein